MGTITAQALIDRCNKALFDESGVRWPENYLLEYLSDGQRQVVLLQPEAYPTNEVVKLVPGTKQTIPDGAYTFITAIRNMDIDGRTPKRACRKMERAIIDHNIPHWHESRPDVIAKHFIYETRDRRNFYVFPPQPGGGIAGPREALSLGGVAVTSQGEWLAVDPLGAGFYRSEDLGVTWRRRGLPSGVFEPAGIDSYPGGVNEVWLMLDQATNEDRGGPAIVARSINGGATWSTFAIPEAIGRNARAVSGYNAGGNETIFVMARFLHRIYKTTDLGRTWDDPAVNAPGNPSTHRSLSGFDVWPTDPARWYVTEQVTNKLYKSTNSGVAWDDGKMLPSPYVTGLDITTLDGTTWFTVCDYRQERIYRSSDEGETWNTTDTGHLEIVYADVPDEIESARTTIALNDNYSTMLFYYMMGRAHGMDSPDASPARAAYYDNLFMQSLGIRSDQPKQTHPGQEAERGDN